MNAINPIFAQALAPFAPPSLFDVTIKFTDGVCRRKVRTTTAHKAMHMALVDARMASPYGSFYGSVIEQAAVQVAA